MELLTGGQPIAVSDRIEDLQQPLLVALYRYWHEKKGMRRWPSRRDIDPLDLKPLLGKIAILDVVYDSDDAATAPRFRYRLFGTGYVAWFGFDLTGRTLDDWPEPEYRSVLNASYREVVSAARPFRRLRRFIKDNRALRYESVMLPLGDAADIEQILVAQVFLD